MYSTLWRLLVLSLGLTISSQCLGDVVVLHLQNGDRLTGRFISEDQDAVVLECVFGRVSVSRAQIAQRETLTNTVPEAQKQLAAQTSGAETTAPTKPIAPPSSDSTAGDPSQSKANPQPAPSGKPVTVAQTNSPAKPAGPSFTERYLKNIHGNVRLGSDLGFGTKDRQFFLGRAEVTYAKQRFQNTVFYNLAYGKTEEEVSANRMDGEMKTTLDFARNRRVYAYNDAGAGYDQIRLVDLSYFEGAGLGYKLFTQSNFVANVELGGQYHEYFYLNDTSKENISASFGQEVAWNLTGRLILKEKTQFLPDVQDLADYRVRLDASVSYPLTKSLTLNLNVIDLYDAEPAPGVDPNDLTVQSSVGLSF